LFVFEPIEDYFYFFICTATLTGIDFCFFEPDVGEEGEGEGT
jgi:hypothetical protein